MQSSALALEAATDYQTFADHWYSFLCAAKGIYTTLEQGAKATPQARQWFGAKNQTRKDDPLLRYVTEARNDDEHGLEESTEIQPSSLKIGVAEPGELRIYGDQYGNISVGAEVAFEFTNVAPTGPEFPVITALDGMPMRSAFTPARIILKPVHDRKNTPYLPPTTHLGRNLAGDSPMEVARLATEYLKALIEEAEGFCKP